MFALRPLRIVALIAFSFILLSVGFSSLQAAGVVNPCTETSLDTALTGGGLVTFGCSGTITITATKTIAADTTIDGAGQTVTISGGNAVRVFIVNVGVTFTLNNITIANGLAPDEGGGILNNGILNTNNATFNGNVVSGSGGGGAFINYGTANITNSTFSNNNSSAQGGAIYSVAGTISITGSNFTNNIGLNGGAIMNLVSLTVDNTTFTGNSNVGTDGGGALYNDGGTAIITNSAFNNNTSSNQGGAIMNGGGFGNSILTLTNTSFSGNSAAVMGGAIMNGCILSTCIPGITGTTTVNGGSFTGNNSPTGGAIANNVGTVDLIGTALSGNTATTGAAISNTATTTSSGTAYTNNDCISTPPIGDNGGNTVNNALGCPGAVAITGTIQFNPNTPITVPENVGVFTVPVELVVTGGTLAGPVTVNVAYTGSATGGGTDYTGVPPMLNFGINLVPGTYTQNITLTIVDDPGGEPTEDIVLTLNTPSGATLGVNITRTVSITDNDSPGATVVQSGGSTDVAELGVTADSYTVVLNTQPATNVIITFTPDAQCNAVVSPLTFTNTDWNIPQTVTVSAVDDTVPEASPHPCIITHTYAGDATYAALPPFVVTANVYDNDTPGSTVVLPPVPTLPPPPTCEELRDTSFTIPPGLYCYVLMRNGAWTRIQGTVPESIVQLGVVIAVDVMYYDTPGHAAQNFSDDQYQRICLRGRGRFLYADIRNVPRTYAELQTQAQGDYLCAWVAAPGTVALVEN